MLARSLPVALVALFLVNALSLAQPSDTIESRVTTLVKKLGSSSYMTRESARKELESLGAVSLDALRKARNDADAETLRRLDDIIRRFEDQLLTKQILTPKEIHLVIKDATAQQAIAELAKISGGLSAAPLRL